MAIRQIPKVVSTLPILKELLEYTGSLSGKVVTKDHMTQAMEIGKKTIALIQKDIAKSKGEDRPRSHSPAKKFTEIMQKNFEVINGVCDAESSAVFPPQLITVAGKISSAYTLCSPMLIGEGSFGILRLHQYPQAFDLVTKQPKSDQDELHQKELTSLYSIKAHGNIIKFFGVNRVGHIMLEYADGGDLKDWTLKVHKNPQEIKFTQIRHIAQGVLCGISYLNQQCLMAHRDVKAENIFLMKDMTPKIGDLGLACKLTDPQKGVPVKRTIAGTVRFLPPEYFQEAHTGNDAPKAFVSDKTDPWAFGHLLYFMISKVFFFQSLDCDKDHYEACRTLFYGAGSEGRIRKISLDINDKIKSLKEEHSDHLKHIKSIHEVLLKSLVVDPSKRLNAKELLQELEA